MFLQLAIYINVKIMLIINYVDNILCFCRKRVNYQLHMLIMAINIQAKQNYYGQTLLISVPNSFVINTLT